MWETLIASYISTLNEEIVIEYAKKQGYSLTYQEASIFTSFLKEHWQELYYEQTECLDILKNSLRKETYQEALKLYEKARQNYLT